MSAQRVAVDRLEVARGEHAGRRLEPDDVDQVVVAAAREVALRLEQAPPCVQHVDRRTRANLEAGLGRLERGLVRFDRLLERRHARTLGDDAQVRVARVALRLAHGALETLAFGAVQIDLLLDARMRHAAGEERDVDLHADRVLGLVGVRGTFETVVGLRRVEVELGTAGEQIDRRHVAAARDVDVALRDVDAEPRSDDLQVLVQRLGDPGFLVGRLRLIERDFVAPAC